VTQPTNVFIFTHIITYFSLLQYTVTIFIIYVLVYFFFSDCILHLPVAEILLHLVALFSVN